MSLAVVEALCRSYTVAGRSVTFTCADDETAGKVSRLVAGWHFTPLPLAPPSAFRIEISRDTPPPLPQGTAAFDVHRGHCFLGDGGVWFLATSDSVMRVDTRRIELWIGAETAQSPVDFARLMFYATQAALRQCGLFELHAAAAVSPAGDGALIIGPSQSGKTTLAMRLTAGGWSNVADDLVLIRDGLPAEAFAFRRVFAATETTLDAIATPHLEAATREPNAFEPEKRRLDPAVLFPGRFASSCVPRMLVFPVISGNAQSELQPIAAPDALTRLLRMCPWATYDAAVARPHLAALASLAQQCASYALQAGTDLLYDAAAAPRLFASLAAGRS